MLKELLAQYEHLAETFNQEGKELMKKVIKLEYETRVKPHARKL